ncbi:MAG: hypothetical protein GYB33_02375 [Gammaproteobacteria bacterium]|nr:hypothetical protein [Gammaproteobacteria bacterium]
MQYRNHNSDATGKPQGYRFRNIFDKPPQASCRASGDTTCWLCSQSLQWRKSETCGRHQRLNILRIDCIDDTLLCDVEQLGPVCHTGQQGTPTTCQH